MAGIMKKIAIVTCKILPEPDPDQELLLGALGGAGMDADLLPWDDPSSEPAGYDLCVLRSCWDYYKHPGGFLKFVDRASGSSRLMNPAGVVRWNHHKAYLRELDSAGVRVIPTEWFNRGEEAELGIIMSNRGWDDVVVKPSVSASSYRTQRFSYGEKRNGGIFLRELLKDRDAMVQRYMPSVESEGEKAVVWIDGEFTHAVKKSPRFAEGVERVSGAVGITPEERALAEKAMARVKGDLLYARVDMVRTPAGKLVISEFELIEPSLFLLQHPPALARLVAGIKKRAGD
jgi:glutathione synthase/RimK-type ligase-like ATP-grasp enzyme